MSKATLIDVEPEESAFMEGIVKHWKNIVFAIIGFSMILSLILRFTMSRSQAEKEFVQVQELYESWERSAEIDEALVTQLTDHMKRHPELSEKLGSSIAQRYIALELNENASEFKQYLEDRRLPLKSPYRQFAEGTYLIASGKYEKALVQTLTLKDEVLGMMQVDDFKQFGKDLYAFTLLRLAMLHREMQNREDELQVWSEMRQFLKDNKTRGQAIIDHLTEQKISLLDYIEAREALLGS